MLRGTLLSLIPLLALPAAGAEPRLVWEAAGFIAPESVVHDPQADVLYVSNMGTHGAGAVAGDGFISRLGTDGRLQEARWITGLDNPKGLAVAGGRLYAGDDHALVEIDLGSGRILNRHAPEDGPGQFNDCTVDAEGHVYVCSGRLNTVFRLRTGRFEPWVQLDPRETGGINGLRAEAGRLLLGGWSVRDAHGQEVPGHLSTVDLATRTIGRIGRQPICHIDGIEPDGAGGYTVTDWLTGEVLHVSPEGRPRPLLTLPRGTADHAYLRPRGLLLIPLMNDNVVRAYQWRP